MKRTPAMGPASGVDDPRELYERIGYRFWLAWRKDLPWTHYEGFINADLRRLSELLSR
jgi:hypothetical protein